MTVASSVPFSQRTTQECVACRSTCKQLQLTLAVVPGTVHVVRTAADLAPLEGARCSVTVILSVVLSSLAGLESHIW